MEERANTLDTVALAALVALWAETLAALPALPAAIPTSFGTDGTPHGYSQKYVMLLLPAIGVMAFLLVALTIRVKARLKLPFEVTDRQMERILPVSRVFQRVVRLEVLAGFVAIQWTLLRSAKAARLDPAFYPFLFALVAGIAVTTAVLLLRVRRIVNT